MGASQSEYTKKDATNATNAINATNVAAPSVSTGHWFNGNVLDEYEIRQLKSDILQNKYVAYEDNIPRGYYYAFTLVDNNGAKNYYKNGHDYSKIAILHILNKLPIIKGGINLMSNLINVIIPILINNGAAAAKSKLRQLFSSKLSDSDLDKLDGAIDEFVNTYMKGVKIGSGESRSFDNKYKKWAYQEIVKKTGGCDCFIGAGDNDTLEALTTYSNSTISKAKDKIINIIIDSLKNIGITVNEVDTHKKIEELIKKLPSADKLKNDAVTHSKLCVAIGNGINKAYGEDIINVLNDPILVCEQISEILNSLGAGVHSEFLRVYTSAKNTLNNIRVLSQILEESNKSLDEYASSSDVALSARVKKYTSIHIEVVNEIKRQSQMLDNIIGVTLGRAHDTVDEYIKKNVDIGDFIKKYSISVGSKGFTKMVAKLLYNIGNTALFISATEKALKQIGMTLDEYKKISNYQELRKKIVDGLSNNLGPDELNNYLMAAKILYDNLSESKNSNILGSSELPVSITRQIDNALLERKLHYTSSIESILVHINKLIDVLSVVSDSIGKNKIKLSDQLTTFVYSLQRVDFSMFNNTKDYKSISGFFNDALSIQIKDNLLQQLKIIKNNCLGLSEMPLYTDSKQYFSLLAETCDKIILEIEKSVNRFNDKFGGADRDIELIAPVKFHHTAKTFKEVIKSILYNYKSSHIRNSIEYARSYIEKQDEQSDNITTAAIASYIMEEQKVFNKIIENIKTANNEPFNDIYYHIPGNKNSDGNINYTEFKKYRDYTLKMVEDMWNAKLKFWKTVEAVEQYLKAFAKHILTTNVTNDIVNMLDNIEVISNWYSGDLVNQFHDLFKLFPIGNSESLGAGGPSRYGHYDSLIYNPHNFTDIYKGISVTTLNNPTTRYLYLPGLPSFRTAPTFYEQYKIKCKSILSNIQALKNLLSIIMHICTINKSEMKGKLFMTPLQIYNNLLEYIMYSSICLGRLNRQIRVDENIDNAGLDMGKSFDFSNGEIVEKELRFNVPPCYYEDVAGPPHKPYILFNDFDDHVKHDYAAFSAAGAALKQKMANSFYNAFKSTRGFSMAIGNINDVTYRETINFHVENNHFTKIIKALCAKVLVSIGLHDILEKPTEYNNVNETRIILGASESYPTIVDEAIPLYLRLPLLAEFYVELFKPQFDINISEKLSDITMLPSMDGIYNGLIKIIFRDNKDRKVENYSDIDYKNLFNEVNNIYQHKSSNNKSDTIIQDIISDFVNEISKRYGLITQDEYDKYVKSLNPRSGYANRTGTDMISDYSILPNEDEDFEAPEMPSAVEKLIGKANLSNVDKHKTKYKIQMGYIEVLERFRKNLSKKFDSNIEDSIIDLSLEIKLAKDKIKTINNADERFKCVVELLRGYGTNKSTNELACLLFHELVVTGTNTLSILHTYLSRFIMRTEKIYYKNINDFLIKNLCVKQHIGANVDNTSAIARFILSDKIYTYNKIEDDEVIDNSYIFGLNTSLARAGGCSHYYMFGLNPEYDIRSELSRPIIKFSNGAGIINANALTIGDPTEATAIYQHGGLFTNISGAPYDNTQALHSSYSVLSVLFNKNVMDIQNCLGKENKNVDNPNEVAVEILKRYLPDYNFILNETIELLSGLSDETDGLITFDINDNKINIYYSRLKEVVEAMFASINSIISTLRPFLSKHIVDNYLNKNICGSYYWLYEQLLEKILNIHTTSSNDEPYINLNIAVEHLSDNFKYITKDWLASLSNADPAPSRMSNTNSAINVGYTTPVNPIRVSFDYPKINYKRTFDKLLWYDVDGSALRPSSVSPQIPTPNIINDYVTITPELIDLNDPYESLLLSGVANNKKLDTRLACRYKKLYSFDDDFNFNRSILFTFNQLISKHIRSFYDSVTQKGYAGIFLPIVKGGMSHMIGSFKDTFPDTVPLYYLTAKAKSDIPQYSVTYDNNSPYDGLILFSPEMKKLYQDVYPDIWNLFLKWGSKDTTVKPFYGRTLSRVTDVNGTGLVYNAGMTVDQKLRYAEHDESVLLFENRWLRSHCINNIIYLIKNELNLSGDQIGKKIYKIKQLHDLYFEEQYLGRAKADVTHNDFENMVNKIFTEKNDVDIARNKSMAEINKLINYTDVNEQLIKATAINDYYSCQINTGIELSSFYNIPFMKDGLDLSIEPGSYDIGAFATLETAQNRYMFIHKTIDYLRAPPTRTSAFGVVLPAVIDRTTDYNQLLDHLSKYTLISPDISEAEFDFHSISMLYLIYNSFKTLENISNDVIISHLDFHSFISALGDHINIPFMFDGIQIDNVELFGISGENLPTTPNAQNIIDTYARAGLNFTATSDDSILKSTTPFIHRMSLFILHHCISMTHPHFYTQISCKYRNLYVNLYEPNRNALSTPYYSIPSNFTFLADAMRLSHDLGNIAFIADAGSNLEYQYINARAGDSSGTNVNDSKIIYTYKAQLPAAFQSRYTDSSIGCYYNSGIISGVGGVIKITLENLRNSFLYSSGKSFVSFVNDIYNNAKNFKFSGPQCYEVSRNSEYAEQNAHNAAHAGLLATYNNDVVNYNVLMDTYKRDYMAYKADLARYDTYVKAQAPGAVIQLPGQGGAPAIRAEPPHPGPAPKPPKPQYVGIPNARTLPETMRSTTIPCVTVRDINKLLMALYTPTSLIGTANVVNDTLSSATRTTVHNAQNAEIAYDPRKFFITPKTNFLTINGATQFENDMRKLTTHRLFAHGGLNIYRSTSAGNRLVTFNSVLSFAMNNGPRVYPELYNNNDDTLTKYNGNICTINPKTYLPAFTNSVDRFIASVAFCSDIYLNVSRGTNQLEENTRSRMIDIIVNDKSIYDYYYNKPTGKNDNEYGKRIAVAYTHKSTQPTLENLVYTIYAKTLESTRSYYHIIEVKQEELISSVMRIMNVDQVKNIDGFSGCFILPTMNDINISGSTYTIPGSDYKKLLGSPSHVNAHDTIYNNLWGPRYEAGDKILYTSLSFILKNLITQNRNEYEYLYSNIADVPSHLIERMKNNASLLKTLFTALLDRCQNIRKFAIYKDVLIQSFPLSYNRYVYERWPHHPPMYTAERAGYSVGPPINLKDKYVSILDIYIRICNEFINTYDIVLREIGDDPKYMEVYNNSLKDAKLKNKKEIYTPISALLGAFQNYDLKYLNKQFPNNNILSTIFKYQYATRYIFDNKTVLTPDNIIGFQRMIDGYNVIAGDKLALGQSQIKIFLDNFSELIRFLRNRKNVVAQITPYVSSNYNDAYTFFDKNIPSYGHIEQHYGHYMRGMILHDSKHVLGSPRDPYFIDTNIYGINYLNIKKNTVKNKYTESLIYLDNANNYDDIDGPGYVTYSLINDLQKVLDNVEKYDRNTIKKMIQHICAPSDKIQNLRSITNILDLGILPINIHTLMHEIPLATLYNYSYTFDRYATTMLHGDNTTDIYHATSMILSTITDPYKIIPDNLHAEYHDMISGQSHVLKGRPKLLSDQIYPSILGSTMNPNFQIAKETSNHNIHVPANYNNMTFADKIHMIRVYITNIFDSVCNSNEVFVTASVPYITAAVHEASKIILGYFSTDAIDNIINLNDSPGSLFERDFESVHSFSIGNVMKLGRYLYYTTIFSLYVILTSNASPTFWKKIITLMLTCVIQSMGTGSANNNVPLLGITVDTNTLVLNNPQSIAHALFAPILKSTSNVFNHAPAMYFAGITLMAAAKNKFTAAQDAVNTYNSSIYHLVDYMLFRSGVFDKNKPLLNQLNEQIINSIDTLIVKAASAILGCRLSAHISMQFDAPANPRGPTDMILNNNLSLNVPPVIPDMMVDAYKTFVSNPYNRIKLVTYTSSDGKNPEGDTILQEYYIENDMAIAVGINHIVKRNLTLIQNIVFIVNCYRTLRNKLQEELTYNKNIIAKAKQIVNPKLTEFYGNQTTVQHQTNYF